MAAISAAGFVGACLLGWWWLTKTPNRLDAATVGGERRVALNGTDRRAAPSGEAAGDSGKGSPNQPTNQPTNQPGNQLGNQTKAQAETSGPGGGSDPGRPPIVIEFPGEDSGRSSEKPSGQGVTGPVGASSEVDRLVEQAQQAAAQNDHLRARAVFHQVLRHPRASELDRGLARESIALVNEELVFSPKIYPDDPLTGRHTVQNGENLTIIVRNLGLAVERDFIARINNMKNPDIVGLNQRLKIFHGPMHAVVSKSEFRLDVYAGAPERESEWIYIRSFPIGLGEGNSTPVGEFRVMRNSKVINPSWRNPITGKVYASDDAANPIGEHWIGLQGDGQSEVHVGYGIHGTVEPDSIGRMMSMGCVRMRDADVKMVYEMLVPEASRVSIRP